MIPALTRRDFLKASLAAASLSASGCVREEPPIPGETRLNFYTYATPEFINLFEQRLVPGFRELRSDIRITVNSSMGDAGYDAKLLTLIAGRMPPDVVHVTQVNFPFYAAKGMLLPLDDLLSSDPDLHESDFYPQLMDGMRFGGKLYGLPSDFSTIAMFYNRDLFDRYGVEYPQPGWTWDDYLAKAKALTRDDDHDGFTENFGTLNSSAYNRWPAWVWMNGGDIFSPDMKRCTMDSPKSIEGLKLFIDLSQTHKVAPTPAQSLGQDMDKMFAQQMVAMVGNSRYPYKQYLRGKGLSFKWDIAPLPRGPAGEATTFIFGGNCILKSTKYHQESWQFLKYMSGAVGAQINLDAGNALPAYRAVAEKAVYQNKNPRVPPGDKVFLDSVKHGRVAFAPSQYADYSAALTILHDAFIGVKSVEEACRDFAQQVNGILSGTV